MHASLGTRPSSGASPSQSNWRSGAAWIAAGAATAAGICALPAIVDHFHLANQFASTICSAPGAVYKYDCAGPAAQFDNFVNAAIAGLGACMIVIGLEKLTGLGAWHTRVAMCHGPNPNDVRGAG